jgi:hypothetical protein
MIDVRSSKSKQIKILAPDHNRAVSDEGRRDEADRIIFFIHNFGSPTGSARFLEEEIHG